ncbi:uncharacterized protein MEPE_06694 [Melanopsichium pennsylvanicum]|uniref:Uncharacterized protein n=2 Tax=Melanopsichium pennsylvanicum TaxID=63383 RepID=A0AAJ4XUI6_9BASI
MKLDVFVILALSTSIVVSSAPLPQGWLKKFGKWVKGESSSSSNLADHLAPGSGNDPEHPDRVIRDSQHASERSSPASSLSSSSDFSPSHISGGYGSSSQFNYAPHDEFAAPHVPAPGYSAPSTLQADYEPALGIPAPPPPSRGQPPVGLPVHVPPTGYEPAFGFPFIRGPGYGPERPFLPPAPRYPPPAAHGDSDRLWQILTGQPSPPPYRPPRYGGNQR